MRRAGRVIGPVVVGALLATSSCGGGSSDPSVRIEAGFFDGRWAATGEPVDDEVICAGGEANIVDFRDIDGGELALNEFGTRLDAWAYADPPDVDVDYLVVVEYGCADGSGSFRAVEEWRNGGSWRIESGIGSSADLVGNGSMTVGRTPATHPDAPAAGAPTSFVVDAQVGTSENET